MPNHVSGIKGVGYSVLQVYQDYDTRIVRQYWWPLFRILPYVPAVLNQYPHSDNKPFSSFPCIPRHPCSTNPLAQSLTYYGMAHDFDDPGLRVAAKW